MAKKKKKEKRTVLSSAGSSSLMCPTIRRRAKAAECKKACKKFKAMTMKAGKRRRRTLRCRAAAAGSRGERRPPQHKFFFAVPTLPMYSRIWRSLFFAFAHFLLYTKDPDLLQALDLPVMPASAGEAVAMAASMAAPLLTAAQGQSHLETHMPASARAAAVFA